MSQKIGILTFHASHNYGSMLQAYALQTYLENLGCEVSIINYRSPSQKMMYPKPYKYWDEAAIKGRLLSPILFYKNIIKWHKFETFLQKQMHLTAQIGSVVDIKHTIEEEKFDAVIVGSDQIWNVLSPDFSIGYLLPFSLNCKKIAYAPSMGDLRWKTPKELNLIFTPTLKDFDAISTREASLSNLFSDLLNQSIDTMPDPAWLISTKKYNQLTINKPLIKGKYLFYYTPQNEYHDSHLISQYAGKIHLKAVCSNSSFRKCPHFVNYNKVGPSEFINLVRNAEFVCGNSMHLLVFALLYHKPFLVLSSNPDTRLVELLSSFQISDRIVSPEKLCSLPQPKNIDWNLVDDKINLMCSKANIFFRTHLLCNK